MSRFVYIVIFIIVFSLFLVPGVLKVEARCTDQKPDHAPNLFQIDTTDTKATLYFTPVNNAVSYYSIIYGYVKNDYSFGVSFNHGPYEGVINYTINELSPNTKYYFGVRAGNGCAAGKWSNTVSAETKTNGQYTSQTSGIERVTIPTPIPIPSQKITESEQGEVEGVQTPSKAVASQSSSYWSLLQKLLDFLFRR